MKTVKFYCGVCSRNCTTYSVECSECVKWYHYKCYQIEIVETSPVDYVCIKCCNESGEFSFEKSLQRLSNAARDSDAMLKDAGKMERVLLCTEATSSISRQLQII